MSRAEVGDKLVDLDDLRALSDDTTTKLGGKLAVPLNEGTVGQILTANGNGTSEWKDTKEVATIEEIKQYWKEQDGPEPA